jgi:peptide/nickel transport system substrate-binding protein
MMMWTLSWASTAVARAIGGVTLAIALGCLPSDRPADIVVYASGADLESANPLVTTHPLARQVQRYALFVTLFHLDSTLTAAPYFARRWQWEDGRRTLRLTVFSGLRWHDGEPTTARDAAFTLDAARDPATGFPRISALATLSAVEASDDTTLVLHFSAPQADVPAILAELALAPVHRLGAVPRADLRRHPFGFDPIGNGPFRFVSRSPRQRWIFERNDDFPQALGGPPHLRRLVVAVVDEATTKFAGLVSGELDVAGISPAMASLVERDPALVVIEYPFLLSTGLVFNSGRPPFDDVRVRRAVSLSIDRQRIIDVALAGYAVPAAGGVPPDNPLALAGTPATDTSRADSLLDASGWLRQSGGRRGRGGARLDVELLTVGSADNAIEQLIQADLAARGIRVEIRQLELATFLSRARESPRRFDVLISGVPGDLGLAHLASLFDSRFAGGALDYTGFHTPRLDSLFARTRAASNPGAVRAAWEDVQRELATHEPIAWIYHSRGVQGLSARLRNVTMDLRGEMVTIARWSADGVAPPGGKPAPPGGASPSSPRTGTR